LVLPEALKAARTTKTLLRIWLPAISIGKFR